MDRLEYLRKHADKTVLGIELAPYFNPVVSKAAGYNVLIVDVFDTETLRERARIDGNIPADRIGEIEPVDIVSDASQLAEFIDRQDLSGKVGYIVSSHNFEHLPDPVRFLQGCSAALKPGGVLTMAIPDCRACFDHFRMPTRLSDWLASYHAAERAPSPKTRFDFRANSSNYVADGVATVGCDLRSDDPAGFEPTRWVRIAYDEYVADMATPGSYKDTHCSTVFGASFEMLVRDLRYLGLVDLEVTEVTPTMGLEFFAYLRKPASAAPAQEDDDAYYETRARLQREVNRAIGSSGFASRTSTRRLQPQGVSQFRPDPAPVRLSYRELAADCLRSFNEVRRARRRARQSRV